MAESTHYGIIYFPDICCPIKYKILKVSTLKEALHKFRKFTERFGTPEYYRFFVAQIDFGQHGPSFLLTDKIDEFKNEYDKIDKKNYTGNYNNIWDYLNDTYMSLFKKYTDMMLRDDTDADDDEDDNDVFGGDYDYGGDECYGGIDGFGEDSHNDS